jgi:hypothetical protein
MTSPEFTYDPGPRSVTVLRDVLSSVNVDNLNWVRWVQVGGTTARHRLPHQDGRGCTW